MPRSARRLGLLLVALLFPFLATSSTLAAGPSTLVRDINTLLSSTGSSSPSEYVTISGITYFPAGDTQNGSELWRSDGTTAGTRLVRDINPGQADSTPRSLTVVGALLFFIADDGISGPELWKSNGTTTGTRRVADISPGSRGSLPAIGGAQLTAVGNIAFFAADDGINGVELWRSDGTAAGTTIARNIAPGAAGSSPGQLTNVNGTLFFSANDGVNGIELWRSGGNPATTVQVKDINPGPTGSVPFELTALGSTLYFSADDGSQGRELWRSDGSIDGTILVKNINPNPGVGAFPAELTNVAGTLYLRADDGSSGGELWRSDGSADGTRMVRDINLGAVASFPQQLTAMGDTLYFAATDSINGVELWKSNGSTDSTVLVKNINPGVGFSSPASLTVVGSTLYFTANDGLSGVELWRSDGSNSGTRLVRDISPAATPSLASLSPAGNRLFFSANDQNSGIEPWISDGSEAGTVMLKDIYVENGSAPASLAVATDYRVFFIANDGLHGRELWVSDSSGASTQSVRDLNPGLDSAFDTPFAYSGLQGPFLTTVGNRAFFSAFNGSSFGLYVTDGTSAGTELLLNSGPNSIDAPADLHSFNGQLAFSAVVGGQRRLWHSNGSAAGTLAIDVAAVSQLTVVPQTNGPARLYMRVEIAGIGSELGSCDENFSCRLIDIYPGPTGSNPGELAGMGGQLYFSADDGKGNGRELWVSNGTVDGTRLVRDINPGAGSSAPRRMVDAAGTLFFVANDGTTGEELWRSDGSSGGTRLVRDIFGGTGSASPADLLAFNGGLIFSAYAPESGREIWRSDGSAAGTTIVRDLIAGDESGAPRGMTRISANRILFSASSPLEGTELWLSDGSAAGTAQMQNIAPDTAGSSPSDFTPVGNNTVFFVADNLTNGRELWQTTAASLINLPPIANSITVSAIVGSTTTGNLSAGDADGNSLTYTLVRNGSQGSATISDPASGAFSYTPHYGARGSDSFTFRVNDGSVDSNLAEVIVNIENSPPVAQNLDLSASATNPTSAKLSAGDPNGDQLRYSVVTSPSKGSVVISNPESGAFTYTPNPNTSGNDSFSYRASDGVLFSNVATVTLHLGGRGAPKDQFLYLPLMRQPRFWPPGGE